MTTDTILVPGARRVEATLDTPPTDEAAGATSEDTETDACVVAAPPHPEFGGHRGDRRLTAVSDVLVDRRVACLRFDYGEWDDGYGEREDTRNALRWAADEFEHVGLFGYSFGATMSLLAAATTEVGLESVCVLAPHSSFEDDVDAEAAVADIQTPLLVVVGLRDQTVDWEPVVEQARTYGHDVVELEADHHFVGQDAKVGTVCGEFLVEHLG